MKNVYRVFILCCLLLLIGCQEESAAEVADTTAVVTEVATDTAVPSTKTAESTDVPTEIPTETVVPTETATPTDTPEPTVTQSPTPTEEPSTETPTSMPTVTNTVMATAVPATATTAPPPAAAPPRAGPLVGTVTSTPDGRSPAARTAARQSWHCGQRHKPQSAVAARPCTSGRGTHPGPAIRQAPDAAKAMQYKESAPLAPHHP